MKYWLFTLSYLLFACSPKKVNAPKSSVPKYGKQIIATKDFNAIVANNTTPIIDIRSPKEYYNVHIKNAVNLKTNDGNFINKFSGLDKNSPIAIYDTKGLESKEIANKLISLKFKKVFVLYGGLDAWIQQGFPVVRPEEYIPDAAEKRRDSIRNANPTTIVRKVYTNVPHPEDKWSFEKLIASDKLVMVDFFADWCKPCKMMDEHISYIKDDLAEEIYVRKIYNDKRTDLVRKYKITGLPTIIFFKNSKEVFRIMSFQNENTLRELIRRLK